MSRKHTGQAADHAQGEGLVRASTRRPKPPVGNLVRNKTLNAVLVGALALVAAAGCSISKTENGICFKPWFKIVRNRTNHDVNDAPPCVDVAKPGVQVDGPHLVGEGIMPPGFVPPPGSVVTPPGVIMGAPPGAIMGSPPGAIMGPPPGAVVLPPGVNPPQSSTGAPATGAQQGSASKPKALPGVLDVRVEGNRKMAAVGEPIDFRVSIRNQGETAIEFVEIEATATDNLRIQSLEPDGIGSIQGNRIVFGRINNLLSGMPLIYTVKTVVNKVDGGAATLRLSVKSSAFPSGPVQKQDDVSVTPRT